MKVLGLRTIPLNCSDIAGTREFVEHVLGLQPVYEMHDRVAYDIAPRARLLLSPVKEAAAPVVLYFEVEDVRQAAQELRAVGYQFVQEVTKQPWGEVDCGVTEPSGHQIFLTEPAQSSWMGNDAK